MCHRPEGVSKSNRRMSIQPKVTLFWPEEMVKKRRPGRPREPDYRTYPHDEDVHFCLAIPAQKRSHFSDVSDQRHETHDVRCTHNGWLPI